MSGQRLGTETKKIETHHSSPPRTCGDGDFKLPSYHSAIGVNTTRAGQNMMGDLVEVKIRFRGGDPATSKPSHLAMGLWTEAGGEEGLRWPRRSSTG